MTTTGQRAQMDSHNLQSATEEILSVPDRAHEWVALADEYMQSYNRSPNTFLLPWEHRFLKPLVETYAHNLEGFCQYVQGLRDSVPRDSLAWERLQQVYRKLTGRHVQQERRLRSDRAVAKAEELYGPTDYHTRLKWIANLEHEWAQRRLSFMEGFRQKTENHRLSVDERAEVLAEFWDMIDTEIQEGQVPPWN